MKHKIYSTFLLLLATLAFAALASTGAMGTVVALAAVAGILSGLENKPAGNGVRTTIRSNDTWDTLADKSQDGYDGQSAFDDFVPGVNPTTGLAVVSRAVDSGGNAYGALDSSSGFDSFNSSSSFDNSGMF